MQREGSTQNASGWTDTEERRVRRGRPAATSPLPTLLVPPQHFFLPSVLVRQDAHTLCKLGIPLALDLQLA